MRNFYTFLLTVAVVYLLVRDNSITMFQTHTITREISPVVVDEDQGSEKGEPEPTEEPSDSDEEETAMANKSSKIDTWLDAAHDFESIQQFLQTPDNDFDQDERYATGTADERLVVQRKADACLEDCQDAYTNQDRYTTLLHNTRVYSAGLKDGQCVCSLSVTGTPQNYLMTPDQVVDYAEHVIDRFQQASGEDWHWFDPSSTEVGSNE